MKPTLTWHGRHRHRRARASPTTTCSAAASRSARRPPPRTPTTSPSYPEGSYTYTVSAVDNAGNEGPARTPKDDRSTTPPRRAPRPRRPLGATPTKAKPTLSSWAAATDPAAPASPPTPCTATACRSAPPRSARASPDTALSANGTNAYTAPANDPAGNTSTLTAPVSVTYDTTAPPAPVGLTGISPTGAKPVPDVDDGRRRRALGPRPLRRLPRRHARQPARSPAFRTHGRAPAPTSTPSRPSTPRATSRPPRVEVVRLRQRRAEPADQPGRRQPDAPAGADLGRRPTPPGIARYDVYRDGVLAGSSALHHVHRHAGAVGRPVHLHRARPSTTRATSALPRPASRRGRRHAAADADQPRRRRRRPARSRR